MGGQHQLTDPQSSPFYAVQADSPEALQPSPKPARKAGRRPATKSGPSRGTPKPKTPGSQTGSRVNPRQKAKDVEPESPEPEEPMVHQEGSAEPQAPLESTKKQKSKSSQSKTSRGPAKQQKVDAETDGVDQTNNSSLGSAHAYQALRSPRSAAPRKAALNHSIVGGR